jgi:hypothetical protein
LKASAPSTAEQSDGPNPRLMPAMITGTTNIRDKLGMLSLLSTPIATTVATAVIANEAK